MASGQQYAENSASEKFQAALVPLLLPFPVLLPFSSSPLFFAFSTPSLHFHPLPSLFFCPFSFLFPFLGAPPLPQNS